MNGTILTVSLVNSEINALPEDSQKTRAKEVAQFARDHYQAIEAIQIIRVVLVHNQKFLFFNTNQSRIYGFKLDELKK